MFNPEKEVPNLELCKKLKELGFPQDGGGWYWTQTDTGWRLGYCAEYNLAPKVKIHMMFFAELGRVIFRARHEIIKAPTITEMWEWLPDFITKLIGKDYGMDYELVLGTSAAGLHIMYQYIHWEKEKCLLIGL